MKLLHRRVFGMKLGLIMWGAVFAVAEATTIHTGEYVYAVMIIVGAFISDLLRGVKLDAQKLANLRDKTVRGEFVSGKIREEL